MYHNITTGIHPGSPGACTAFYNGHTLYNHHNNPSLQTNHQSNYNGNYLPYYPQHSIPTWIQPAAIFSQFYPYR